MQSLQICLVVILTICGNCFDSWDRGKLHRIRAKILGAPESAEQKEARKRSCQDLLVKTMQDLGHGSDPRQWSFEASICEALEEQGIE